MAVTGLTMPAAAGKLLLRGAKRMKGGLTMSKSVMGNHQKGRKPKN